MQIKEFNQEVLYSNDEITTVGLQDIKMLKEKALDNERKRIRLCAHKTVDDTIHEMLIIHARGAYVRPHKHLNKSESFHVIEGFVDVVIFDEQGNVSEVIPMGDYSSGLKFYYRIDTDLYHTIIIKSDFLVFHETTKGPFIRSDTVFAPWAPEESDAQSCREYMQKLGHSVS